MACSYLLSCLLLIQFVMMLLLGNPTTGSIVPAIIVFGDSSVDAGNNNYIPTIARSNFEPYGRDFDGGKATGRFSNGRIATDFISEALGLKPYVPAYLDPNYNISDFAVGVSFASAGSGYDNATSDVFSVISLWKEVEYYKEYQQILRAYLGEKKANETIAKALYMISMGTNDFLENYYALPNRRNEFTVDEYIDFLLGLIKKFVRTLYNLGARKISLAGLPPMGCMPLERATNTRERNNCTESYNTVALDFNNKLAGLVISLNREFNGISLVMTNPYYVFMDIIKNPSAYGFEESAQACCATGLFEMGYACNRFTLLTCTDANKYVFWDAFHPSEKTNRIIAEYVVKTPLRTFL